MPASPPFGSSAIQGSTSRTRRRSAIAFRRFCARAHAERALERPRIAVGVAQLAFYDRQFARDMPAAMARCSAARLLAMHARRRRRVSERTHRFRAARAGARDGRRR